MMRNQLFRIIVLMLLFVSIRVPPLYAVADLDVEEEAKEKNSSTPASAPGDKSNASSLESSETQETKSKEYSYSFTLPLPAGNVLPVIPDRENILPGEQNSVSLPPVVPIVKKPLSWRNHALHLFTSTGEKSVIFKSFPGGTSDLITALINQSAELNYQTCTDFISAGHMLIEVPEKTSETKKQISYVLCFRIKDDSNCELALKVLPPVSKYSLNLAQNFLSKVERKIMDSKQNTF